MIQGDTLSPLLFIVALEPLLRWLDMGDRGYQLGCVQRHAAHGHVPPQHVRAAGGGYADDVVMFAGDAQSFAVQLDKVGRYSEWSGMRLNASKCEISAVLHATTHPTRASAVKAALQDLSICGEPLTNIVLPTKPFKYLGVYFTMSLDWTPQRQHARSVLQEMVEQPYP